LFSGGCTIRVIVQKRGIFIVVAQAKKKLSKHSENKWALLALLVVAQFMVVLDVSIVNVALPSMAKALHFASNNLQWVITAYTLTFGGFLLLGGRAADIYGRRRMFIGAVFFFALASLFCGLAQTSGEVIIARAVQGLAGAFMSPAALSIIISEFREGKERNTALGIWSAVSAGGAAVGLLLGGVLTQYLDWRWNFFVNVPVGIFVVLTALRLLPHHIGEENETKLKLDLPGAVLATAGLMSLVYGLSKAPNNGWGSTTVWEFIATGIILLIGFVINERRTAQPMLPLSLFRIRNVLGANAAFLVISCTLFSMFFFMTLYVQQVLGYSPVKTGISFLPVTFIIAILSGVVSKIVPKIGYKPPMNLGPLLLAIGLFTIAHTMKVGGNYWHNVFPGLALFAAGMGFTFVSGTLAATSGVPRHLSGIASGVLNTSQQVGGAIGLAILSAIAFSASRAETSAGGPLKYAQVHGFQGALDVGAILALIAAVVVFFIVKNEIVDPAEALKAS
jgi:EmrB/QacA subfamily drug resistance transporter